VLTSEYHLRQAEIAAGLALAEPDPAKAAALSAMARDQYDRAEKAKLKELVPDDQLTKTRPRTGD
jgi:hypothetical protein